jgi:hypothetical protein
LPFSSTPKSTCLPGLLCKTSWSMSMIQALRKFPLWVIVALLPVLGCRTLPHCTSLAADKKPVVDPVLLSRHVLEVDSQGFLFNLRSTDRTRQVIKTREDLTDYLKTNVFAGFQASGKKKLMLFVHGGLNDRKEGMEHFWRDYGEVLRGEYYPVFVVWPSGWKATYVEHLLWVRQGVRADSFNQKVFSLSTSPFVLLADLGRALTRLPMVIANNSRSDAETTTPIRVREGGAAVQQYQELAREDYAVSVGDDYSRTSDRFLRDASYWATLPVKYFMASLIDGLGKGAWDNMLRRTQEVYPARMDIRALAWTKQMAETNSLSEGAEPKAAETKRSLTKNQQKRAARYAAAGLPVFIELLTDVQKRTPGLEVAVIGHSMGSIILNRVVRDAKMDFAHIIYMGAACSIEDFTYSVLPYMKEHPRAQFYNLTLHPVAETGEWFPEFADLTPRGSLLIWIDNFLGNPLTEQERTMGTWRNLFRNGSTGEPMIHRFFTQDGSNLKERLHFQAFSVGFGGKDHLRPTRYQWNEHPVPKDVDGRCDNPLSHGEFTEMPYWDPNFWWQPVNISGGKPHQSATK